MTYTLTLSATELEALRTVLDAADIQTNDTKFIPEWITEVRTAVDALVPHLTAADSARTMAVVTGSVGSTHDDGKVTVKYAR